MAEFKLVGLSLDDNKDVYRSGDIISGSWVIQNEATAMVKGISCYLHGAAYVKWEEIERIGHDEDYKEFISHQQFICEYINLFGNKTGEMGPHHELPAGNHNMKFKFTIPIQKMPSSYEGVKGAIRYWLQLVIERPVPPDIVRYKCFTYLDEININELQYTSPLSKIGKKKVPKSHGLAIGDGGQLDFYAKIDRSGYCPGENIVVSAYCKNSTDRSLSIELKAYLLQFVLFRGGKKKKAKESVINSLQESVLLAKDGSHSWNNKPMKIVAIPPSTSKDACNCLSVHYFVRVMIEIPFKNYGDIILEFPVTMGTVAQTEAKQMACSGSASNVAEGNTISYVPCNKGWSNFKEQSSTKLFCNINYQPLCAYVSNYKAEPKRKVSRSQTWHPQARPTVTVGDRLSFKKSEEGNTEQEPQPSAKAMFGRKMSTFL